eukprot:270731_1
MITYSPIYILIVIMLFSLFGMELISATMACDGIEYKSGKNTTHQIPAGVCRNYLYGRLAYTASQKSEKYVCLSHGSDINIRKYSGLNCQGEFYEQSATDYISNYDGYRVISVTCCSGNACDYGMIRKQEILSCSNESTFVYVTDGIIDDEINIVDSCAYKYYPTHSNFWEMHCANNTIDKLYYNIEDGDCTGASVYEETITEGGCDLEGRKEANVWTHYNTTNVILCGTAEPQCTSAVTTLPPIGSNLDCNGVAWKDNYDNIFTVLAGVCNAELFADSNVSIKVQCTYDGNDANLYSFGDDSCSNVLGDPISMIAFMEDNEWDYAIECCKDSCDGADTQNVDPSVCETPSTTNNVDSSLLLNALFNMLIVSIIYVLFI